MIAVDPSSPLTGGAIMGDRIRMMDHAGDEGVFVRSMASRGALGGLAATTWLTAAALDAAGYDPVVIETVGAGQSEVEIATLAETTVVVEVPEMGDEVQAIKAGLLEIADVIVVNKGDRPGAERAARQLKAMLSTAGGRVTRPAPTVLMTVATAGEGSKPCGKRSTPTTRSGHRSRCGSVPPSSSAAHSPRAPTSGPPRRPAGMRRSRRLPNAARTRSPQPSGCSADTRRSADALLGLGR